jgi:hypothetical protein
MKSVKFLPQIISLSILAGFVTPQTVQAETIWSRPNQIQIRGVIADRRTIIVDSAHKITSVISNTNKDVLPEVRLSTFNGPRVGINPAIISSYYSIMSKMTGSHIGTISLVSDQFGALFADNIGPLNSRIYRVKSVAQGPDHIGQSYEIYPNS